jgi:xanthine dehydrogenase YagR molybdenum-binding subunit
MNTTTKTEQSIIGSAVSRVDGPLKVSGEAMYTADQHFPGMLYAMPVTATIARGQLTALDIDAAAAMPGVQKIFTRQNIGKLYRISKGSGAKADELRPPLADDTIRYYGQYIALVVADSFERAVAAANVVKASYREEKPDVSMALTADGEPKVDTERGDAAGAYDAAVHKLDHTYTTPPETHNPIELHSTVALYDGKTYTLYETSQAIVNHKAVLVQMLGEEPENVRVITRYLGSGFGGKLWPWTHAVLAAAAARDLRRPVKLEVTRQMMFQTVGHRANTQQRIRLAATPAGRLTSLRHEYIYHTAREEASKENCGEASGYLYSTPNLRVTAAAARRDVGANTSMRGPGAVPGLYALESAMDEMAIALDLDPVQFRLMNEPQIDESLGVPFSTRHLAECLTEGAEKFGWSRRNPKVGSMRAEDGSILGWGVASASWIAKRLPAEVQLRLSDDGHARVACACQDIGTGTYTVVAQMVAQHTGLPLSNIQVVLGDTSLPPGPMSGGSMLTGSMVPAVAQAARAAIKQILATAASKEGKSPYAGAEEDSLAFTGGRVHRKDQDAASGVPFEQILKSAQLNHIEAKGSSGASAADKDADKHSIHSYGAHFVEVAWQPEIARLRVNRVVTMIDAGQIINPRTGRNQIEGAVIMGVGMALFEQTHYDTRNGAPINSNLADYVMTTHADAPRIDVHFLDYPDRALNELGARGIGEIGLAGFAAAVTAAVYHATGVRVRDLPVQIDDLI